MLDKLRENLSAALSLIYPELCTACGRALMLDEQYVCLDCRLTLPKTGFHLQPGNLMERLFWGKFPVHSASAYLYFRKGERTQNLLHQIKYKGMKEAAELLGEWYGRDIDDCERFKNINLVVPVPLHKKKERKRGYNQSAWFGKGLAKTLKAELSTGNLIRTHFTDSQTRKGRVLRWENVAEVFKINHPEAFEGKHILLVDDVITTGATLEACAQAILQNSPSCKISIVTLAFAGN